MTDSSWPSAFSCPQCLGFSGLASKVQAHRPGTILVDVQCKRCAHQWQLERDSPTYAIRRKKDRRQHPRRNTRMVTPYPAPDRILLHVPAGKHFASEN
jgi:hypothetical protein